MDSEGKYLTGSPNVSSYAPDSVKIKGVLLLVGAIVIWGANWPVMKAGLSHMTPIWLSTARFVSGALCLFALQILTKKLRFPPRKDWPLVVSVRAAANADIYRAWCLCHDRSACWPIRYPGLHHAALGHAYRSVVFPSVAFTSAIDGLIARWCGVIVLFNPFTFNWGDKVLIVANLMLLTASFAWAMCILHLRYHKGVCSAYELAPWQMLLASVPLALMARVFEGPYTGDGSTSLIEILLFMGPLATAFCFVAVNAASMWLSSTSMSTAMLGVPIIGLLMSVIFLGEQLTLTLGIGLLVIMSGIFIVTVKPSASGIKTP